jgi:hypothetical protein
MSKAMRIFFLAIFVWPIATQARPRKCVVELNKVSASLPSFNPEEIMGPDAVAQLRAKFPEMQLRVERSQAQLDIESAYFATLGIEAAQSNRVADHFDVQLVDPAKPDSEPVVVVNFDLLPQNNGSVIVENLELANPAAKGKLLKQGQELPGLGIETARFVQNFMRAQHPGARLIACPDTYAGMIGYSRFGKFRPIDEQGARVLDRLENIYRSIKNEALVEQFRPQNLNAFSVMLKKSVERTPAFVESAVRDLEKTGKADPAQILPLYDRGGALIGVIAKPDHFRAQIFVNTAPAGEPAHLASWRNMIESPDSWRLLLQSGS